MVELPAELFAQLLPLQGGNILLLPKAAVLEVQAMDAVSLHTDGPSWLLGFAAWRDNRLPVVSLEALAGGAAPARSRRSRLVVINSLGTHLGNGLFIVVTQGYPQLTVLNSRALAPRPLQPEDKDIALARVRLANTEALIPDLEALERRIAQAVAAAGNDAAAAAPWAPRAPEEYRS